MYEAFDKKSWRIGAIYRLFVRRKIDAKGVEELFKKHKMNFGAAMPRLWASTQKYKRWPKGEWE